MKNFLYLAAITILLFSSCKSGTKVSSSQLTGKLVIAELCDHYVISVEKGKIDPAKVVASYRDEKRATTFTNVFTVANTCSFSKSGLHEGDIFSFELTDASTEECARCMAFYPTPDKKLFIKNYKKISQ